MLKVKLRVAVIACKPFQTVKYNNRQCLAKENVKWHINMALKGDTRFHEWSPS